MTVKQLYEELDKLIPSFLSCDWDNDGLMCCPEPEKEVHRVLVCLDATADACRKAIDGGYDVIVTHHPLIFKGLNRVEPTDFVAAKVIELIKHGISVFSFHTRLDAVEGGVNDTLAAMLGLTDVIPFADGIGRIGVLPTECTAEDLAKNVKELLHADGVFLADAGRSCRRVAVLGGNGGDDIDEAVKMGADTYISGDFAYHSKNDAPDRGINLLEAGHFFTEDIVCGVLSVMVECADESVKCDIYESNRTKLI